MNSDTITLQREEAEDLLYTLSSMEPDGNTERCIQLLRARLGH